MADRVIHMPCGCPYPKLGDHRPCEHGYPGDDDAMPDRPAAEYPEGIEGPERAVRG